MQEEIKIIRELAKRYAEIAELPIMAETRRRMVDTTDLKPGRPLVLLFEVPWHEMNIGDKLTLRCNDPFMRAMEERFRRALYQWEYFPGDFFLENAYTIQKSFASTDFGFDVEEKEIHTDHKNNIYSHWFVDQLANEEDVEKLRMPVVTAYPEKDKENIALAQEILDGVLDVELRGHDIYHAPWDTIARYRGVETIYYDLADRPEHLHRIMERYTEACISQYEQMEKLGLFECRNPYLHCTPAFSKDVPGDGHKEGEPLRFKNVWFRSMAQMFSEVSPEMHEEFDLQYGKRIGDRCALTYYGCCEPLSNKISVLRKNFKNLRKIGVSPWADEEASAEQIGGDFVYSRKPNPALVAHRADPETIRQEIKKTVEICMKYNCPYELILKDISTVSYRPENLTIWEKTVRETLDEYYYTRER